MLPWKWIRPKLNQILEGWANYFSYGTQTLAYRAIDNYVYEMVSKFLADRHNTTRSRSRQWTAERVFEQMGVTRLKDIQYHRV